MINEISEQGVKPIITETALKCMGEFRPTKKTSQQMNAIVGSFHRKYGNFPTFNQIKALNDGIGGINCILYAEAACDLLRRQGITAEKVIILELGKSRGAIDNHAIVFAADSQWMDPVYGKIFGKNDWVKLKKFYGRLLNISPDKIVAYSPLSNRAWLGKKGKEQ